MLTLYHYTCDDGAPGIEREGLVRPLSQLVKLGPAPSWAEFAWFTDLARPCREGLGLTSHTLSCDRLAHRFRAIDAAALVHWSRARLSYPPMLDPWVWLLLEREPAQPEHWWLSPEPVRVWRSP